MSQLGLCPLDVAPRVDCFMTVAVMTVGGTVEFTVQVTVEVVVDDTVDVTVDTTVDIAVDVAVDVTVDMTVDVTVDDAASSSCFGREGVRLLTTATARKIPTDQKIQQQHEATGKHRKKHEQAYATLRHEK